MIRPPDRSDIPNQVTKKVAPSETFIEKLNNEKQRIIGIADRTIHIDHTRQTRRQITEKKAGVDKKIVDIFSTFPLPKNVNNNNNNNNNDDGDIDVSYAVRTSNIADGGVWLKLQQDSDENSNLWKNVIDKLEYPDIRKILWEGEGEKRIRKSVFTPADIIVIGGGGMGLYLELTDYYCSTGLRLECPTEEMKDETEEKEEKAVFDNFIKGMFIDYVLGYNEMGSIYFLTLFVAYLGLIGRRLPVKEMLDGKRVHTNKASPSPSPTVDLIPKYEVDKSCQYTTTLDLLRKEGTIRYRFISTPVDKEEKNHTLTIKSTHQYGVLQKIDIPAPIATILKFFYKDKLLLVVVPANANGDTLLIKLDCTDITKYVRINNISFPNSHMYKDTTFIDSTKLYDTNFASYVRPTSYYSNTIILDLLALYHAVDSTGLSPDEKVTWNKLSLEFRRDNYQELKPPKGATKTEVFEWNQRRTLYDTLTDKKENIQESRNYFLPVGPLPKITGLPPLYVDHNIGNRNTQEEAVYVPLDEGQRRIMASKVISLPHYRNQKRHLIIGMIAEEITETGGRQLYFYASKFFADAIKAKRAYEMTGDAYEKELGGLLDPMDNKIRMDLIEEGINYEILDFDLYFYNDDTCFIQLSIKDTTNPEFPLYYTRSTRDFISKFPFIPTPESPFSSGGEENAQLFSLLKQNNYSVLQVKGSAEDKSRVRFDHVFYKDIGSSCRFIFMKLVSEIPGSYQVDIDLMSQVDLSAITQLNGASNAFAHIIFRVPGSKPYVLKISSGGDGFKEYDRKNKDATFLQSAFHRLSLNCGGGGGGGGGGNQLKEGEKTKYVCSYCGLYTTKFDHLASNYYCDRLCQTLFVNTRRMRLI